MRTWLPLLLLFFFILASGCTVSPRPKNLEKPLVSDDNPIFDNRFQGLSYQDLDFRKMWVEGKEGKNGKNVPIHNNTFAEIVEKVKGGVVNLYTRGLVEKDMKFGISPNDILPFRIPLVSALFDILPFQIPIPFRTEGFSLGSGFIINEQGYILTNAHVVHNATDIRVVFSEGTREFPAKIIGLDRVTDTALIKMESNVSLTVLPLGDSDRLRMGEMVIAIGNPLGLRHSVSFGIVSATERVSPTLNEKLVDFIQTDSAINPGNSGGPLINFHGEVVGINTALVSKAQSIGFAVPINTTKEVMSMLVLGKTERGWFGATAAPLGYSKAVELGYQDEGGVLVLAVDKGSPAAKAGIEPKDIIMELDGQHLINFQFFRRKLLGYAPGHKIHMVVFRDGETREISSRLVKKGSVKEK